MSLTVRILVQPSKSADKITFSGLTAETRSSPPPSGPANRSPLSIPPTKTPRPYYRKPSHLSIGPSITIGLRLYSFFVGSIFSITPPFHPLPVPSRRLSFTFCSSHPDTVEPFHHWHLHRFSTGPTRRSNPRGQRTSEIGLLTDAARLLLNYQVFPVGRTRCVYRPAGSRMGHLI